MIRFKNLEALRTKGLQTSVLKYRLPFFKNVILHLKNKILVLKQTLAQGLFT